MLRLLSAPLRLVLLAAGLCVCLLPRRWELWLGARLGRLSLALRLFRDTIASENIRRCFPGMGAADRKRLLERNFEHYGILALEYLHFFSPLKGHYRAYMDRHSVMEGLDNWKRAHAKGKGVIFFACHLGYWEMLAAKAAMSGIPLTVVTTTLKPDWLDARITAARSSTGVRAALHPGSLPAVLRALKKGESVAFMNDQYARPPMGLPVRFFGVKVNTLAAVGPIAKRTGAAVVPGHTYRDRDGVSHIVIEPELDLGGALDSAEEATQILASKVEHWVRGRPEQWLWLHRRFKNVEWPAEQA